MIANITVRELIEFRVTDGLLCRHSWSPSHSHLALIAKRSHCIFVSLYIHWTNSTDCVLTKLSVRSSRGMYSFVHMYSKQHCWYCSGHSEPVCSWWVVCTMSGYMHDECWLSPVCNTSTHRCPHDATDPKSGGPHALLSHPPVGPFLWQRRGTIERALIGVNPKHYPNTPKGVTITPHFLQWAEKPAFGRLLC